MVISGLSSALQGLQAAERRINESASNVARLTSSYEVSLSAEARSGAGPSLETELVGQISAVALYRANLKSIQTMDEVSGVLISLGRGR